MSFSTFDHLGDFIYTYVSNELRTTWMELAPRRGIKCTWYLTF